MVGASVDLDDQAGGAPEEVRAVAAAFLERYPGVDLGVGKVVAFDYREEALLGFAAGEGGAGVGGEGGLQAVRAPPTAAAGQ